MLDILLSLLRPENLIAILIGVAAFATVLTLTAPLSGDDVLKARMKLIEAEKDRLRAGQRALSGKEARLRDAAPKSLAEQLVKMFNLRRIFEADSSRDMLRQAGLRSERHLMSYLASRLVSPIMLALLAYVYSAIVITDLSPQIRMVITVLAAVGGYYLPVILLKNLVARRQISIQRAWSDALDLLLICVESGMAVEPALQRVASEIGSASVPLAEELTLTVAELSYLQDRRKAFENLAKRTGMATVKSVTTSLIQSERYGTPLGTALRVLAQENRDARMSEAERKAAALPPRLTVPMIMFFLPVILIVIMGPAIMKIFETFSQ
jgi:tight adherence protein C